MKRAHLFAPGVIEYPEPPSFVEKFSRVVLVVSFLLALGVIGGQIYQHLAWEVLGL